MAGEAEAKAVLDLISKSSDVTLKILEMLFKSAEGAAGKIFDAVVSDKSDKAAEEIKQGQVKLKDLQRHCKKNKEELHILDNIPKRNLQEFVKKAKENFATFSVAKNDNSSEYVKIACPTSDLATAQKILTEIIQDNLRKREGEFNSIDINDERYKILRNELVKTNVEVDFLRLANGTVKCVFPHDDLQKVNEIAESIDKSIDVTDRKLRITHENDTIVMQNIEWGKEKSYSTNTLLEMGENELTEDLKDFGLNDKEIEVAVIKVSENLSEKERETFYKQGKTTETKINFCDRISLKDDELTKDYSLYQVNLKETMSDSYILMNADGKAVKLEQPKDIKANTKILEDFGITDKSTITAILLKYNAAVTIVNDKSKALAEIEVNDKLSVKINRMDRKNFNVKVGDKDLNLSFSDRVKSIQSIALAIYSASYNATGIKLEYEQCEGFAKQCFDNAKKQCIYRLAEIEHDNPILRPSYQVDRQIGGTFTVTFGEIKKEYPLEPKDEAIENLKTDFGIEDETALEIFTKAEEQNAIEEEIAAEMSILENNASEVEVDVEKTIDEIEIDDFELE